MYDASFDRDVWSPAQRWLWILRLAAVVAVIVASSAAGQMPGTPILQNVWATPGVVGAVNVGGGSDGSVYAAAGSWTPGSGRFEVSGGAGFATHTGTSSTAAYGARVALPFGGASSSFGLAAFAGVGGGGRVIHTTPSPSGIGTDTSSSSGTQIPVGAAVGWRKAIGTTRGFSVFGTPAYVFETGGGSNKGLFRVGVGVDFGITSSLGATVGGEFGTTRPRGLGGPSGSQFGVGVSYAFGKR